MKKIIAIVLSAILVFSFATIMIVSFTKKNDNVIRVNEVTHSIFYAPFYIAITQGFFEDENIEIELTNGGGSNNSMNALLSGEADIALLGPEATIYVARGESTNQPKMFGQLTKRDGALLIAKENTDNFEWTDLVGKVVLGGRKGGVPYMTLKYVIEEIANLEIGTGANQVDFREVDFNLTASVFDTTDADYCTMFEPAASALIAEGKGYAVASVGTESGEIPYTGFAAKESFLSNNPEKVKSFLRAVKKGYDFLVTKTIDEVVTALAPQFSTTSAISLKAGMETYLDIDAYAHTPVMDESAFDYLQDVMINAGELTEKIAFNKFVTNIYAIAIEEEFANLD